MHPGPRDTFVAVARSTKEFSAGLAEDRKRRNQYWIMLHAARQEFLNLTEQAAAEYCSVSGAFFYYLRQNYGLQVELKDGKIAGEYAVVDEKKYLLFLMKFGS